MTQAQQNKYHTVFDKLKAAETKEDFLDGIDTLLDEIFEDKIHAQHNLDVLSDDDWWTGNMS